MDIANRLVTWVGEGNYWIVQVFAIVLLTLLAAMLAKVSLDRLLLKAEQTHNLWDDAFVGAARRPLRWLIWLIGLTLAAQMAAEVSENQLAQLIQPLRKIGVVGLLTWFLVRLIRHSEDNLMDPQFSEKPMDATTVKAIGKLLRMSVLITAVLVVLQSMGYSISGVLAFGGIGGIAVGFAAKDLLANFFGGLMIYLDRPFSVGDWIRSPDKEIEGTVEDIGWRLTRIRTFDKRPLYIPNSTFAHISLENPSRMSNRRIYETIGVRYEDSGKLPEIIEAVKAYLRNHPEIDQRQTLIVNFNSFAACSLDFFIYTFTKTTDWIRFHEIKQEILLDILGIIERHGAECAFPTSTVHMPDPIALHTSAPVMGEQP
ncbi:mechanosensitive ion channel [Pseudomaricurvus alkylphenolicus]|jgi:MscS family membrane protein|uniref:mechanosensitive ion channel family protein n=1 Tax=Pseudomaricurvus alkylphenolicus TaxID=1306991 RepID=UPI00142317D3|nr:mechanosensitive ion channel domain-containing protein [Pseudomaricurvus alkylphenolicus]NIB41281.1 mechanosensitive ion channel [Pseudomaricurvus alkylphenolicus]